MVNEVLVQIANHASGYFVLLFEIKHAQIYRFFTNQYLGMRVPIIMPTIKPITKAAESAFIIAQLLS
jgi:hypothetical protein